MIDSISFRNLKALKDTILPLGRFTLIVGPNGSGKSTALQAINMAAVFASGDSSATQRAISFYGQQPNSFLLASAGGQKTDKTAVEVSFHFGPPVAGWTLTASWIGINFYPKWKAPGNAADLSPEEQGRIKARLARVSVYAFDPTLIAAPVSLQPALEMGPQGSQLAGVLDQLRDQHPEQFEALNQELVRWLPEFDRILFETPAAGKRSLMLRTCVGGHSIKAADLSHGTLISLAMLTLAYLPDAPPLIGFEEPERGLHPRLFRLLRDALYRLSHPESIGMKRDPVQVVATTHSPYFLDLFKEHPEEIVIAQKEGIEVQFKRLSDRGDIEEILADAPLGEVWFSGILGGVPGSP
jgi:predicted ATPase